MNCRSLVIAAALWGLAAAAEAGPLSIVHVNAPAYNTVFDLSGTILVQDSVSTFAIAGGTGEARLQSRTTVGQPGAPAAGKYMYAYRLNLTNVMGIVNIPCVSSLTLNFGPVTSTLDYNGDGDADQVFVVTSGGLGSVAPTSAVRTGNSITFSFASQICAGGSPGTGESSYFFGLTSPNSPKYVTATVQDSAGPTYSPQARAARSYTIQIGPWLGRYVLQAIDANAAFVELKIDEADERRFRGTMSIADARTERALEFDVEGTMSASGMVSINGQGPAGHLVAHGQESPLGEGAEIDARLQLMLGGGRKVDGKLRLVQSIGITEPPHLIREWGEREPR